MNHKKRKININVDASHPMLNLLIKKKITYTQTLTDFTTH